MPPIQHKIDIRQIDFKEVFEKYFSSLCVFAYNFVKDEDLAKDLVQEVFVKIWQSGIEFESEKSMKVYFYLATKNKVIDHLRKEKRIRMDFDIPGDVLVDENTVLNEMIREETYRLLEKAMDQLPPKAGEVIRLNLEGFSNQEIAEKLSVSVNTVKTHKLNAFKTLRQTIGPELVILLLVDLSHSF